MYLSIRNTRSLLFSTLRKRFISLWFPLLDGNILDKKKVYLRYEFNTPECIFFLFFFFFMKYAFRLLENIFFNIACSEMAEQTTQVIKLNLIIISSHLVVFTWRHHRSRGHGGMLKYSFCSTIVIFSLLITLWMKNVQKILHGGEKIWIVYSRSN